jgi:hypothetical protein
MASLRSLSAAISILPAAVLVTAAGCVGVYTPPDSSIQQAAPISFERVRVDAAVAVGFAPLAAGAADAPEGAAGLASAMDEAVTELRGCLADHGVRVRGVRADRIVIDNGPNRDDFNLTVVEGDRFGCYLAVPGRPARVVRASEARRPLAEACAEAAALYYPAPECCPEGAPCCPGGVVREPGTACPRTVPEAKP